MAETTLGNPGIPLQFTKRSQAPTTEATKGSTIATVLGSQSSDYGDLRFSEQEK